LNILITGITGFVGSHLADFIVNHYQHRVYGLARWRSPLDNISHLLINRSITLRFGDLLDLESIEKVIDSVRPNIIFHLAAQSYVPYSHTAPISTLQTNVIGSANLFFAARRAECVKMVHVCSSSEVYGQPEYTPMDEAHPLNPVSPYGVSKAAVDLLAQEEYEAHGLPTVRTRAFTHTGPRRGDVFVASAFAKQIVEVEMGHRDTINVGNLTSIRTFCDVRDMVRAYWLTQFCSFGQVYNIGGCETMSIENMLQILISLSTAKIEYKSDLSLFRHTDVTLQIPDTKKFTEKTGWEPEIPLRRTLNDLLEYHRAKARKNG